MSETGATGAERLPSLWIRAALGVALVVCPAVWWLAGAGVKAGAAAGLAAFAATVPYPSADVPARVGATAGPKADPDG